MRVAVFGASGLVGATVVQRLRLNSQFEVLPLIHSTGRAWRLARLGISMETGDLLNPDEVHSRLSGCTHIVNCSRGPRTVMIEGLKNLLNAARKSKIQRVVHLSSVSAYGDLPPGDSISEDHQPGKLHSGYAKIKAEQDQLIDAAVHNGLDCVSLCPPMITGPYSGFVLEVRRALENRKMAIVDDGKLPCPTADVLNVAYAVERALLCRERVVGRVFITDGETANWADLVSALRPICTLDPQVSSVTLDEALQYIDAAEKKKATLRGAIRHLASSKLWTVLREDPLLARTEQWIKSCVGFLPSAAVNRMKASRSGGSVRRRRPESRVTWDSTLLWRQTRRLSYSIQKAQTVLGYEPRVNFAGSMEAFIAWYETHSGFGGEHWDLLSQIKPVGKGTAAD